MEAGAYTHVYSRLHWLSLDLTLSHPFSLDSCMHAQKASSYCCTEKRWSPRGPFPLSFTEKQTNKQTKPKRLLSQKPSFALTQNWRTATRSHTGWGHRQRLSSWKYGHFPPPTYAHTQLKMPNPCAPFGWLLKSDRTSKGLPEQLASRGSKSPTPASLFSITQLTIEKL
jgi:hypothetical protein